MKELFLPYDLSLEMKNIGFDEPCLAAYDRIEMLSSQGEVFKWFNYNSKTSENYVSAPMYFQCVDFFREKHGIHILITTIGDEKDFPKWHYEIQNLADWKFTLNLALEAVELNYEEYLMLSFPDYYSALTEAIRECIKIVKIKNK